MLHETILNADHAIEVYEIAALILWRARELMHACGRGDAYPAKYHLMLAIRLLADPPSLPVSTRPAGEDYVRSMRETLLTDRRARQIAADAHTLVVAAAAGLGRAFNAQAFRKVDATQLVVDMAQRRTAAE